MGVDPGDGHGAVGAGGAAAAGAQRGVGGATLGLVAFQEPPLCRGATKKLDDRYGLHRPPPAPRFWVGNPVTNRWKFIPGAKGVPGGRAHYEFVVVDGAGYRIVAVALGGGSGGGGTGPVVAVYDSRTEEWRLGVSGPRCPPPLAGGGGGEPGEEVVLTGARKGSVWVVCLDRAARVVRYRAGGVSGAGDGERVEVVVEAADRVAGQDGGVLVSPWAMLFGGAPAAAAVAPAWSGSGGVHVYEFVERRGRGSGGGGGGGGGGWVLETSSRLGGLKALFGKLASDGGARGGGRGGGAGADCGAVAAGSKAVTPPPPPPAWARGGAEDEPAEVLYLSYAGSRQAMYNVGKDEFALLPEHSRDAASGHSESSCAFYPRFDMQP